MCCPPQRTLRSSIMVATAIIASPPGAPVMLTAVATNARNGPDRGRAA